MMDKKHSTNLKTCVGNRVQLKLTLGGTTSSNKTLSTIVNPLLFMRDLFFRF